MKGQTRKYIIDSLSFIFGAINEYEVICHHLDYLTACVYYNTIRVDIVAWLETLHYLFVDK